MNQKSELSLKWLELWQTVRKFRAAKLLIGLAQRKRKRCDAARLGQNKIRCKTRTWGGTRIGGKTKTGAAALSARKPKKRGAFFKLRGRKLYGKRRVREPTLRQIISVVARFKQGKKFLVENFVQPFNAGKTWRIFFYRKKKNLVQKTIRSAKFQIKALAAQDIARGLCKSFKGILQSVQSAGLREKNAKRDVRRNGMFD